MPRYATLLAALITATTLAASGCRSCDSCHDYDPPVAGGQCNAYGTHRAGSASGCGCSDGGCATGGCSDGSCTTGGCGCGGHGDGGYVEGGYAGEVPSMGGEYVEGEVIESPPVEAQ